MYIIFNHCSPGMPPSRVTQMGNGGAYANSWSSESLLREQHSGWVHHHSQWIINFDWPLSKPKCNKWLHKTNRLSSGKTTIHQSLSHFPIPSSQSKTYWTLHLLFLHTIDCPHQEVTTVPSSIKIKTTEFRHVYPRLPNSGHVYMLYGACRAIRLRYMVDIITTWNNYSWNRPCRYFFEILGETSLKLDL